MTRYHIISAIVFEEWMPESSTYMIYNAVQTECRG